MNINLFLEDFDNDELSYYEWEEQMKEAVNQYNEEYGTDHMPKSTIRNYSSWKREKNPNLYEQ